MAGKAKYKQMGKVKRGVNVSRNGTTQPGVPNDKKNDKPSALVTAVKGVSLAIIGADEGSKDKNLNNTFNDIKNAINGQDDSSLIAAIRGNDSKNPSVVDAINQFHDSFKDRFGALLAAVYGWNSVSKNVGLDQFKSRLQRIDITNTPFNTLNKTLLSILTAIDKINSGDQSVANTDDKKNKKDKNDQQGKGNKSTHTAITGTDIANMDLLITMINDMNNIDKKQIKNIKYTWACVSGLISSINRTKIDKKALSNVIDFVGDSGFNKIVKHINKLPKVNTKAGSTIVVVKTLSEALVNMLQLDKHIDDLEDIIDVIVNIIGDEKDKDHEGICGIVNRFNDIPEIKADVKKKTADLKNLIVGIVAIGNSIKFFDIVFGFIKLSHVNILLLLIPYTIKLFNNLKPKPDAENKEKIKTIHNILIGITRINILLPLKELIPIKMKLKLFNSILSNDIVPLVKEFNKLKPGEAKANEEKINTIISIFRSILNINGAVKQDRLLQVQYKMIVLNDIVSKIPSIWTGVTKAKPNKTVNTAISSIIETLNMLTDVDSNKLTSLGVFGESICMMNLWLLLAGMTAKQVTKHMPQLNAEMTSIATLMELFSTIDGRRISVKKAHKLQKLAVALAGMNLALSLVWVTGGMAIKGLNRLVNDKNSEIHLLNKLIEGLGNIDTSPIEDPQKLKDIIKTITLLGVMNLALTAVFFTGPTAVVGMFFIKIEISMLKKICGDLEDIDADSIDNKKLKDIAVLIAFCSGIMIIAGYVGKLVMKNFIYIMTFSMALGVFMVTVIGGINLGTRGMKDAQKNITEFGSLIGICGLVMIIGGMIMMTTPELILGSFQFAIALGAFIALVGLACTLGTRWMKAAEEQINTFGKLILISCATMLIGSLFVQIPGLMSNALLFGLYLGAFILIVTSAYVVPQIFVKGAMKYAKEFSKLLIVSAALMIFGAIFIQVPDLWYNALLFGVILGAFVFLVTLAYTKGTKGIRRALPNLAAFFIIVIASSVILFVGGSIIQDNPWLVVAVAGYIVLLVGFIFGFSYALKLMREKLEVADIIKGLLIAGAVTVLIVALTYALNAIDGVKLNWIHMLSVLLQMGVVITAVTSLCTVLGLLMDSGIGAVVLASGAAAVLAIAGILLAMVAALNAVESVNGKTFDAAKPMIESFCNIIPCFEPLASLKLAAKLVVVTAAVINLAACIAMISMAVQLAANLTIVTFDKNGQPAGYRHLQESDFENAANNVKKIVSILGSAIIEIYEQNPEIFSTGSTLGDLLGMNTRFSRVCKSCATLGQMISKISEGVKDYASLRIPTYDNNGKVIGSRAMTETDFSNAAKNVGLVITSLGKAVIDVYNMEGAKEMFEWHLFGDNKFVRVVKSTSKLGKLISDIGTAIRDYANLRVNVYDKDGKVVGNRAMTPIDFILAGINVSTILTTLGAAIIKTYNDNPQMFAGYDAEGTPMYKVVKGMQGAGRLIMEGAWGIKAVMGLDINDSEEERKKIADKVAFCVGVLADSLLQCAYVEYDPKTKTGKMINPAFDDDAWFNKDANDTPVGMVKQALSGTKKLIDEGVSVINDMMKLNIPNEQVIRDRANLCVAVLADAIHDLAVDGEGKPNPAFCDDAWFNKDVNDTPVGMVKQALAGVSKLISEGATTVGEVLKLNVDADTCGSIVQKIFESLPNAILNSTIYNKKDELKKFWTDDPDDKIENIITTLKSMTDAVSDVADAYKKFVDSNLITSNGDLTSKINASLNPMLTAMTSAFVSVQSSILDADKIKKIVSSFNEYKTAISTIVTIYTTTYNNLVKLKAIDNTNTITATGRSLIRMVDSIVQSVRSFNSVQNIQEQMTSFTTTVDQYARTIVAMGSALNSIPDDYTNKTENLNNAIRSVNELVAETPYYREILRFDAEVKAVEKYVKTVNSINGSKVDKLTRLSNALTTMSTKLGSLEGLTDVLANKVAVVLAHLSDQMAKSANVIKTAENIQNKRHEKITAAMKQLKHMMDTPLNVSVVHRQETDKSPDGGTLRDTPQNSGGSNPIDKITDSVADSIDRISEGVGTTTNSIMHAIMQKVKQYIDSRDAQNKKGGRR